MIWGSNSSGARFSARPDWPLGPPSLQYNGYWVFPGGKVQPGRAADHSPPLVPWSWKSRAIPLPTLWATTGPVMGTLYLLIFKYLQIALTNRTYFDQSRLNFGCVNCYKVQNLLSVVSGSVRFEVVNCKFALNLVT